MVEKKKLAFRAIAVAAAIDSEGHVVASHIVDGAINIEHFCTFLDKVGHIYQRKKTYMLVDNLNVHHSKLVQNRASHWNIELLFNGTYSSTFNPIERLWAWAKRRFQAKCVESAPYHRQERMRQLVTEVVHADYSAGLKKHISTCL